MKKVIILVLSFLAGTSLFAQITLEHTYNLGLQCGPVNLSISGYKYIVIDSISGTNVIKLYNMNHTIWKTINLNVPSGYKLLFANNVSETLFNSDALVEIAYTYNKTTTPYDFGFKVTNESGIDVFTYPIHQYVNLNLVSLGSNGTKMILCSKNSSTSTYYNFDVYSLPGQLLNNNNEIIDDNIKLGAFPNPAINNITITYEIPGNNQKGELIIYNITGSEIRRYKVDNNFNDIFINTSEFLSGTYLYKVVSGSGESQTKKFIIE